jgi:hypothetical protein
MKGDVLFARVMQIFGLAMVAVYIGLGIFLMVSKSFVYIDLNIRIIFGSFFIIYGVYRLVRIFMKLKGKRDYEDE